MENQALWRNWVDSTNICTRGPNYRVAQNLYLQKKNLFKMLQRIKKWFWSVAISRKWKKKQQKSRKTWKNQLLINMYNISLMFFNKFNKMSFIHSLNNSIPYLEINHFRAEPEILLCGQKFISFPEIFFWP